MLDSEIKFNNDKWVHFQGSNCHFCHLFNMGRGRSGGAMVLGKLPVPGRPTFWIIVGQGPIALAVGADGGCVDIFSLLYPFSPLSSLWETARYRLKYCLKGPLNPKQSIRRIRSKFFHSRADPIFGLFHFPGKQSANRKTQKISVFWKT